MMKGFVETVCNQLRSDDDDITQVRTDKKTELLPPLMMGKYLLNLCLSPLFELKTFIYDRLQGCLCWGFIIFVTLLSFTAVLVFTHPTIPLNKT